MVSVMTIVYVILLHVSFMLGLWLDAILKCHFRALSYKAIHSDSLINLCAAFTIDRIPLISSTGIPRKIYMAILH